MLKNKISKNTLNIFAFIAILISMFFIITTNVVSAKKQQEFTYLAIGNSITIHGICDYWWDNRGMAATKTDKDYYHIVLKYLKQKYGAVSSQVINLGNWEIEPSKRNNILKNLEKYLDKNVNLVTLQLGENVTNLNNFEQDFSYLVKLIKSNAPNAKIIVVGDFEIYKNRNLIKSKIAKANNVIFIDLKKINHSKNYRAKLNSIVYDKNGNKHVIKHKGVANHPNDKAMEFIAKKIIETL